jgi:hypothetical protein
MVGLFWWIRNLLLSRRGRECAEVVNILIKKVAINHAEIVFVGLMVIWNILNMSVVGFR